MGCLVFQIQYFALWFEGSPFYLPHAGLLVTGFLINRYPCLLYSDDRHNRWLEVTLDEGENGSLATADKHNLAAAESSISLVACYLVRLG